MNMRLSVIPLFLMVAACLLSSFYASAEEKMSIGVSTPLSGNEATFGEDVRDTVRFANSQLANDRYDLIFEDDKCNGRDVVSAAKKLLTTDKIEAAIVVCSGAVLGSAPLYERAKILAISPYASSPAVSTAGEYIFRTWPSDISAGKLLSKYASENYSAVGVLTEQTEYCVGLEKAFAESGASNTVKLFAERFLSNDRDVRSILLRLKSKKIDALFINTQSESTFLNAFKQSRAVGLKAYVIGAYWPGSPSFREAAPEDVDGIVFVDSPLLSNSLTTEGKRFYQLYVKTYGEPNSSPFLFATTFEAFRVVHLALQSGRDPKNYLYESGFKGIIGNYSFDSNGDVVGVELALYKLDGREPVLLK